MTEPKKKKLTDKQKLFVEYYIQSWNATQAAKKAKYKGSYGTLKSIGAENLSKPYIREEIEKRVSEIVMTSNETLVRLGQMAKGVDLSEYIEMKEIFRMDEDGKSDLYDIKAYFDIEKFNKDGHGHLIKSVTQTSHGIRVELHDQMSALVHIGKHQQLFIDKLIVEGEVKVPFTKIVEAMKKADEELED